VTGFDIVQFTGLLLTNHNVPCSPDPSSKLYTVLASTILLDYVRTNYEPY